MSRLIAIVMAAGRGTRMKSPLPKVLHEACGRPLIHYPVRSALEAGADQVRVVCSPDSRDQVIEGLKEQFEPSRLCGAVQETPRGTGDAVRAGTLGLHLEPSDRILILSGDTPLLTAHDLRPLLDAMTEDVALCFMYFIADDPTGYGRVLLGENGLPTAIVEHKDLEDEEQRKIREVNAGVYLVRAGHLMRALSRLSNENAQGEYYLTDIVAIIAKEARAIAVEAHPEALLGVNDRQQLRLVEKLLFEKIAEGHARRGVSIVGEPLIDDMVWIESDARIEDGVRLRGATRIGAGSRIDVGTVIDDTVVGRDVHVKPYCVLSQSQVGDGVQLGPFAHLRPHSALGEGVHVGNFVETKNSALKQGCKVNHLSYVGDAEIGERTNLGAGTIVCNYDGFKKRRTVVGADVFVGSDSQLIAPVTIGSGAYVATATTVTQDVPEGALAIGRSQQTNKLDYAAPLKERLRARAEREKEK